MPDENPVQPQGADPVAPERGTTTSAGTEVKTFTQDQVNALIQERLTSEREKARVQDAANVSQQIKDLQEKNAAIEARALTATIRSLGTGFHPGVEKFLDLKDITSDDTDKIQAQLDALKTSHPFLVKSAGEQPKLTPTFGAGESGEAGGTLLTLAQMDAMTPEDLKDPEKNKLYIRSRQALRKQS